MNNFSPELEAAIEAMTQIMSSDERSVLADRFNKHITYIGKIKARSIVVGDTVVWEYGGLTKTGKVVKVNRKTMEVANTGNTPFGSTITKINKSMILGKADV